MKRKAISIFLSVLFIISNTSAFDKSSADKSGRSFENQKHLIHCPANSNSQTEKISKAFNELNFQSINKQTLTDSKPIIEINSDITTNQIWTADNVYYVTDWVNVQALLVIEPGTIIMFGDGYGYYDLWLDINSGGTLISKGTPDKPIIWTCDFLYPDWGYYYEYLDDGPYYYCPIYIEETASPATTVTYNFIEGALAGIVTQNIKLDHPLEHNYLMGNFHGIGEYGTKHTDIRNNLCYYNYYVGIDVHLADVNRVGDANSVITIQNNTCDTYQNSGITVHGVADENDSGLAILSDNIVSGSYENGLNFIDGYVWAIVTNTGYYDDPCNKNWDFEETFPVIATQNPYVSGAGLLDICHLNQNCPFINAGLEYVEETPLIGMTTDISGAPDSNVIDLGFHYPNWNYSNAGTTTLQADFNNDLVVDFKDLYILADYWLFDYNDAQEVWMRDWDDSGKVDFGDLMIIAEYWLEPYDFTTFAWFAREWQKEVDERLFDWRPDLVPDGIIDFKDFAVFASQWGQASEPLPPDIQPLFNQDPNNFKGFVQISADIFDPNVYRVFILMDGQKYSEFYDFDQPISGIQTDSFANGRHSFKIVRIENDGSVINSELYDVNFNNEVSCITADSGYSSDKGYSFYAMGSVGQSYNAQIKDLINDNVIYTSDFNDNINLKAAASVFTEPYHIYSVVIKRNQGGGLELFLNAVADTNQQTLSLAETDDEIVNRIMARKFNYNVIDANVKMVVSIGSKDMNDKDVSTIIPAVIKAADSRNLKPQYLPYEDCTWENLRRLLKDYPNVTYWYHDAHGDYQIPVLPSPDPNHPIIAQRTSIGIKESYYSPMTVSRVFSKLKKDYGSSVPGNYQDLGIWEYWPSIAELGFESNPKLEYIRMNACFSARYPDFAVAAGIISGEPYYDPLGERIYIGWNDVAYFGDWYWKWGIVPIPVYYNTFENAWFYHQSIGDSVGRAATNAIMDQPLLIRRILWEGLDPNIKVWGASWFYFYFGQ